MDLTGTELDYDIPICRDPPIIKRGCVQLTHHIYDFPALVSDYKLNYAVYSRFLSWEVS